MWELDHKEGWVPKNYCFWIVVLEKTPERPLDSEELQPIHPRGNQPWIFIGRLKLKLQYFGHLTGIQWPPLWKRPWCWEGLGAEGEGDDRGWDGWVASLIQHEFEWTLGVGDGQGGLACCDSWGQKESDTTKRLNWTESKSMPQPVRLKKLK